MDFITHLPRTRAGYDSLMVIVDYVTKMMILRPTYSTETVVDTARTFMDAVVRLHGLPRVIVSDRDTKFTSSFWREVCRVMGTTLAMSLGFHLPGRWADREGEPVHQRNAEGVRG